MSDRLIEITEIIEAMHGIFEEMNVKWSHGTGVKIMSLKNYITNFIPE